MQETWMIVGVVLLAVLVGAAVPVLFQLFATLRETRKLLGRLGPKVDGTLTEVREASQRMNRIGSELETSARRAKLLLDVAGDLGEAMRGLRESLKVASALTGALGPALAAAVRALTDLVTKEEGQQTVVPVEEEQTPDEETGAKQAAAEPREERESP
jgi:uncharacterized protein YoxC